MPEWQHAGEQGNAEVLHGDCGQIGDEQGEHQIGGLQLTNLAFAHQAQADDNQKIEDNGADKCDHHAARPLSVRVV